MPDGQFQVGVVFILMILNTIVHINNNVAKGLQDKIKDFAKKGLTSYTGGNDESARVELITISTCFNEQNMLPAVSVNDIIEGLTGCRVSTC